MQLEISRNIFQKLTNIKFHKNPSRRSRVVPCGRTERQTDIQTDRHDETKSCVSKFYEGA